MDSKKIIARMDKIYWFNSLLPIMLLYVLDSVLFTTAGFSKYVQPVLQVVMIVYATMISLYNIISKKAFVGKKIITFSMIAFIVINFISFFVTYDKDNIFAFYLVYMGCIHYLALGLPRIDIDSDKRRQDIEIIMFAFIIVATFVNMILLCATWHSGMLLDIVHGEGRLSGFVWHPNVLGFYSSLAAFLLCYVFMKYKGKGILLISVISLLINCITLYLSKSRSSEIFLIVSYAFLLLIFIYRKYSIKTFILFLVGGLIICSTGIGLIVLSRGVEESLSLYKLINNISSGRLSLYNAGICAGIKSPIWGNSYSYLCDVFSIAGARMAHNIFIDLFARYGFFSLVAFCIFNFSILFYAFKIVGKNNKAQISSSDFRLFVVGLSLVVGLLVQHLFDIAIYYTGFSASNVLYLIFTGYLAYWIAKIE